MDFRNSNIAFYVCARLKFHAFEFLIVTIYYYYIFIDLMCKMFSSVVKVYRCE